MIAFRDVQDNIRRLAQMKPEEVTEDRYFYENGLPCCIVGHVIEYLGAKAGPGSVEIGSGFIPAQRLAPNLPWEKLGVRPPSGTQRKWIGKVQELQDEGHSWRVAVNAADEEFYEDD